MTRQTPTHMSFDELFRKHAREEEPVSSTMARILASGDLDSDRQNWPDWIGAFEGPGDLGINAEKYLGIEPWGPGEEPREWPSDKGSD